MSGVWLSALAERLTLRDPDAWEILYRRCYSRLFAYARRRTAGTDEADDAVSETMSRAIARIDRFEGDPAVLTAWLFGILRNVLLESYRNTARETPSPEPPAPPPSESALEQMLVREEARDVRAAFNRLSPEEQEILELRVVGQLDSAVVATVLGKSPGAVRMAQSRALARLQHLLQRESRP